jgi:Transposase DDE domain group 1
VDAVLDHNETLSSQVDFIIKWNPRKKDPAYWLDLAEKLGSWNEPRPGKRVGLFDVTITRVYKGYEYTLRRVMRIVERTIDKQGQYLAIADIEVEGWWTSLGNDNQEIIDLYADHGTSEQFHSEFKTDMDIERLPSGKFSTNALVLACSVLVYNILRWIGQNGLTGPDAPLRHKAKRRRIKTVMQELIYLAAKFTKTGRRFRIIFGKYCRVWTIFDRLYYQLAYG